MIETRRTITPPPAFRGPRRSAFDYFVRLVADDPAVRALVPVHERVGGPLELATLAGMCGPLPRLYFACMAGTPQILGTKGGRTATSSDLRMDVGVVVAGSDPTDAMAVWDAIDEAVIARRNDDRRLAAMWDAGVSGVFPDADPAALASGPEASPARVAALGSFRVRI